MVPMIEKMRRREETLYGILEGFPDVGAVVIGGYGASAWSFPRFSHDLDLLVHQTQLAPLHDHLSAHGLTRWRQRSDIEQNYGGSWERWVGGADKTTIDLLVNSVQDRDFEIAMPYAEVYRDHVALPLRGITSSSIVLPVASKEVLIALKSQVMRPKDIGDICALAYTGYDTRRLRQLLDPILGKSTLLAERIEHLKKTLGTTSDDFQRVLAPRIPKFRRIHADLEKRVATYIDTMERWIRQVDTPNGQTGTSGQT
jgi:hypothetical protein